MSQFSTYKAWGQCLKQFTNVNYNCIIQGYVIFRKPYLYLVNKSTFLCLSLIIEGATEKVSQFIVQMKSIYTKTFV